MVNFCAPKRGGVSQPSRSAAFLVTGGWAPFSFGGSLIKALAQSRLVNATQAFTQALAVAQAQQPPWTEDPCGASTGLPSLWQMDKFAAIRGFANLGFPLDIIIV